MGQPSTVPTSDEGLSPFRSWILRLFFHSPVVVFLLMAWSRRWMSDDGFINLRIVRNFLNGHGLVYNLGERVEAGTSTLWVFWLSFLGFLGVPLAEAAVYSGIFFAALGLLFALWGALTLAGLRDWQEPLRWRLLVIPLGMAVFAVIPPAWDFASSGLETGMSLAWLGLVFWWMCRYVLALPEVFQEEQTTFPALFWKPLAFVLGLAPLIRPELTLFTAGMSLLLVSGIPVLFPPGQRWKTLGKMLLWMGFLPVSYQLFRMGYFATLAPNTALAKEAFRANWGQGLAYFENFFSLYNLLVPLSLLFLFQLTRIQQYLRQRSWRVLFLYGFPVFCGMFYVLYVVRLGGCFMHGRLFLPAVFAFLLPVAVLGVHPHDSEGKAESNPIWRWAAVAVILLWIPLCGSLLRVGRKNHKGIGDERGWYARQAKKKNPIRVKDYKRTYFFRDASYVTGLAAKRCPGGRKELKSSGPHSCSPTLYVDRKRFGRIKQYWGDIPLAPGVVDSQIVMVVQRVAIGIRGMIFPARIHLVDGVGLADPLASRMELTYRHRPGHEKYLWTWWFLARFAKPRKHDDYRVKAARQALRCGLLKELLPALREPMSWKRFWKNVGLSFQLHRLRIPPHGIRARQKFCGR